MKDLKQAAARGVAWNLVQNLIGRVLSLVVVAVLARYLDRAAFGGVSVALTVIAFAELLVTQGYGEFITQRPDLSDEQTDTAFWVNSGIALVLTGFVLIAAEPLARFVDEPSVANVMRWLSLTLVIRAASVVPTALLVRHMQFRSLSLRSLVAALVGGSVGITAAISGMGIYALVLQNLLGELAASIFLWTAVAWRPSFRFSKAQIGELSRFGLPIFAATLLNFVSRRLDTFIIVSALGVASLGTYYMAQRVFQIANQIVNKSGDSVALSAMSRVRGEQELRHAIYRSVELTGVLCFPIYTWMAVLAAPLVHVMFGPTWLDSVPVLAWFGVAGIPLSLSYLHAAALKAVARTRMYLLLHIILAAVYLPVLLAIVDRGPVAGAIAYLIGCLVIVPIEITLLRSATGIALAQYLKSLVGSLVASLISAAAAYFVVRGLADYRPLIALLVGGAAGLIAYVVALLVCAPATFSRCRDLIRTIVDRRPRASESQ
jgi:O-antigen/teichoic acid export membrane protein